MLFPSVFQFAPATLFDSLLRVTQTKSSKLCRPPMKILIQHHCLTFVSHTQPFLFRTACIMCIKNKSVSANFINSNSVSICTFCETNLGFSKNTCFHLVRTYGGNASQKVSTPGGFATFYISVIMRKCLGLDMV